ncbi:oligosaccharide flippase family protein|uniref:oligosaccharide flippase family protein n=1 Tax=Stenotrophomonas sp. SbOxS2 TaxID=2723885 RepID=UPI0015D283D0|nr:oligosaccharide flippase family protein [Stenotrophomonas sp. SbOxS2]NYT99828.1 oligosaccharide flippase family protein [Stenotrophomonas sp. SbOxS2]
MSNLYRAIAKSMGSKYLAYAMQFAALMILARAFTPEVFGTIAAIQVFYLFFQLVGEGGFGPAIIGLHKLNAKDRDGIFGLTILIGVGLAATFVALGSLLVDFYKMPDLPVAIPFVAAGLMLNAWAILPMAQLQRQQSFLQLATAAIIAELVALALVLLARKYVSPLCAISIRIPTVALVNFTFAYHFSRRTDFGRPRPGMHFSAVAPLLKVSGYQLAFNVLNFFSRNLDNVLVGKYLGAPLLGIYDRSYQLMRYPLQLLTFAMTPAIQPALRGHANSPGLVLKIHQDLTFKLSLLGLACALGIYVLAAPIILVAFGEQWLPAVPVIKLLSLTIPVQVVLSTSGSFFQTFQRTDLLFRCGLFSAATNVTAIIIGISLGSLEHLCWALLVSFHINFFQAYYLLHKHILDGGFRQFLHRMIPAGIGVGALATWHALH